ncbi:hypothetical protein ID866_10375 [Astraeus odoratus]|nr:hypothetical protein ID866_10375 [Astraeus odoratus]
MRPLSLFISIAILTLQVAALRRPPSISIPLQKRASLVRTDGSFDLERALQHLAFIEAKISAGLHVLAKKGKPARDVRRRDAGDIALTDSNNLLWYGNISVGTPPINLTVDFDTGSADLILPGGNCSTCRGHTLYNPNASSTAVNKNSAFVLTYGDGSTVEGEQYTDTVVVAGLAAVRQALGVAHQYPTILQASRFPADGVMGMALEGLSIWNANPVVQTLLDHNVISDPVFAFKLSPSGSELSIGSIDSALCTGPLTYAPITGAGFWQIQGDAISTHGKPAVKNFSAIVDTGANLILGDKAVVRKFYNKLGGTDLGNGFYTLPCNSTSGISITIKGKDFPLSRSTFNLGTYPPGSNRCVGAIAGSSNIGTIWVLGDAFLQNVYSVFDIGNTTVGFAPLA